MDSAIDLNVTAEIAILTFSKVDYSLFIGMLAISTLIGIYFGFYHRQDTVDAYLFGGKNMHVFPIAMSLVSSNTSAIALLAVPADIYKFGGNYVWVCVAIILGSILGYFVYIQVFLKLQVTSTYEYLNVRFDKKVRVFASLLFTLSSFMFNPVIIYVPALAFAQATGMNVHFITPIVCSICIFYTTVGGLKAVVWTDTLQTMSIAVSLLIVFFMGIVSTGGVSAIYETARKGHRLDIWNFDINPTLRDGFWMLSIGGTVQLINQLYINQGTIQRLSAVPLKNTKKVMIIFCTGLLTAQVLCAATGLIIYARYANCDPVLAKRVAKNDQIVPYYVMDVAGSIPGLPGLFIAGVFSAGLSTLSTTLNTLSCTIYEDFVVPFLPPDITEKRASNILKLIAAISGILSTLLVFVVQHLGGILPLVLSFLGITGGPLLGLFTLGMLFPSANAKGALCGGIVGLFATSCVIIMNQWYKVNGMIKTFAKPVSVEGCSTFLNSSLETNNDVITEEPFALFRISHWYYITFGVIVVVTVGLIVSRITSSKDDPPVHPDFISPVVHRFYFTEADKEKPYLNVELTTKSQWK